MSAAWLDKFLWVERKCESSHPNEKPHTHRGPGWAPFLALFGILVFVIASWTLSPSHGVLGTKQALWLALFAWMLAFICMVGWTLVGLWRGALINERKLVSLARFQAIVWTAILLSALLAVFIIRLDTPRSDLLATQVAEGVGNDTAAFAFDIPQEVQAVAGVGLVSAGAAAMVSSTRRNKDPDPAEFARSAKRMISYDSDYYKGQFKQRISQVPANAKDTASSLFGTGIDPSTVTAIAGTIGGAKLLDPTAMRNPDSPEAFQLFTATQILNHESQGALYSNPRACDARFADMLQGDEVTNTTILDLAKLQMLAFTVLVAWLYAVSILESLAGSAPPVGLPSIAGGAVGILGLSHLGFLGGKAAGPTRTV